MNRLSLPLPIQENCPSRQAVMMIRPSPVASRAAAVLLGSGVSVNAASVAPSVGEIPPEWQALMTRRTRLALTLRNRSRSSASRTPVPLTTRPSRTRVSWVVR